LSQLTIGGSKDQCAEITPAVRYFNKNNSILANVFLVRNDVAAEFLIESASLTVVAKNPQACCLQLPVLQLLSHYAHERSSEPAALKGT
jgi:hypothetical protein